MFRIYKFAIRTSVNQFCSKFNLSL